MKIIYLLALLPLAFSSCNSDQKTKGNTTDDTVSTAQQPAALNAVPTLENGCYVYEKNGDYIAFKPTVDGDKVTGPLVYALAEKDKNTGTFTGQIKGDQVIGIYTFNSEGSESIREMVFQIQGKRLLEGFGEINSVGNKVTYKDLKTLSFNEQMPLEKGECNL